MILCCLLAGGTDEACVGLGFTGGGVTATAYDLHGCGDCARADGRLRVSV